MVKVSGALDWNLTIIALVWMDVRTGILGRVDIVKSGKIMEIDIWQWKGARFSYSNVL